MNENVAHSLKTFETHVLLLSLRIIKKTMNVQHTFWLYDYRKMHFYLICLCMCRTNQGIDQIERHNRKNRMKKSKCAHSCASPKKEYTDNDRIHSLLARAYSIQYAFTFSVDHIQTTIFFMKKSMATSLVFRCGLFHFAFSLFLVARSLSWFMISMLLSMLIINRRL